METGVVEKSLKQILSDNIRFLSVPRLQIFNETVGTAEFAYIVTNLYNDDSGG